MTGVYALVQAQYLLVGSRNILSLFSSRLSWFCHAHVIAGGILQGW